MFDARRVWAGRTTTLEPAQPKSLQRFKSSVPVFPPRLTAANEKLRVDGTAERKAIGKIDRRVDLACMIGRFSFDRLHTRQFATQQTLLLRRLRLRKHRAITPRSLPSSLTIGVNGINTGARGKLFRNTLDRRFLPVGRRGSGLARKLPIHPDLA